MSDHPLEKYIESLITDNISLKEKLDESLKERLEEAKINGIGADRELTLLAKIEVLEKRIALMNRGI